MQLNMQSCYVDNYVGNIELYMQLYGYVTN